MNPCVLLFWLLQQVAYLSSTFSPSKIPSLSTPVTSAGQISPVVATGIDRVWSRDNSTSFLRNKRAWSGDGSVSDGSYGSKGKTLTILGLFELSRNGSSRSSGVSEKFAAELALKDINRKKILNKYKLTMLTNDTQVTDLMVL